MQAQPCSRCLLSAAVASALGCWMSPVTQWGVPQPCVSRWCCGAASPPPPPPPALVGAGLPAGTCCVERSCSRGSALPRPALQDRAAMLRREEEGKGPLIFLVSSTRCFGGWSRAPCSSRGAASPPTRVFHTPVPCWEAAARGIASPPQKPQTWEVGGGVGKPKIQPSSNSHPPL